MTIELGIDIETIPTSRADVIARYVAKVEPPGQYKKPESIAQWWASEGDAKKQEAIARTALDGTWGEIICIGLYVNDEPAEVLTRDGTEHALLTRFGEIVEAKCKAADHSGDMWQIVTRWIGHNIIDFDLRFLWQRQKLLGVKLPFNLPMQRNQSNVYDTMKEWAGYKERVSMKDLELAFGIGRDDPLPLGGAEVFQAYQNGRIADIAEHCRVDVENLRGIYRKMTA
jgi:predicted PolB exonuclease-like 3'-5' exonuclease